MHLIVHKYTHFIVDRHKPLTLCSCKRLIVAATNPLVSAKVGAVPGSVSCEHLQQAKSWVGRKPSTQTQIPSTHAECEISQGSSVSLQTALALPVTGTVTHIHKTLSGLIRIESN